MSRQMYVVVQCQIGNSINSVEVWKETFNFPKIAHESVIKFLIGYTQDPELRYVVTDLRNGSSQITWQDLIFQISPILIED